ncbi:putative methyltransferase TARBP1 [Lamellibrachia satsuma]|nr:putative methyltransferase TARBP1 [Lamellibrachia satsuma]
MYLLKRILDALEKSDMAVNTNSMSDDVKFWWRPEAKKDVSNVWNDYILLMETLEEKQTHVIKPLMSRLDNLFKATIKKKPDRGHLHASWVTSLLQRIACHESMTVRRWGVMTLLTADYTACPFFEQQVEFFSGPLVVMLTESSIYYKSSETPKDGCCPLVTALVQFFTSCQHVLEQPQLATFLQEFLHSVRLQQWNGAALVYVTYGLSQIKQSPVWGPAALNDIGCILRTNKQNLNPYTRGAIQCSLVKSLMRLINTDEVSVDDFTNTLALLPSDESIKRGTCLWDELLQWLPKVAQAGTTWEPSRLWEYIENSLAEMTKISSTENPVAVMSQQRHVAITRLLLLLCDSCLLPRQPGGDCDSLGDTLHSLLSPVINVIWSVKFHPYVSAVKAETAMAFLVTLAEECQILEGSVMTDVVNRMVDRLVENSSEGLLLYSQRRIPDIKIDELQSVHLCCRAVLIVVDQTSSSGVGLLCLTSRLVNACIKTLQKFNAEVSLAHQLPCHAAMMFLGSICESFSKRFGVNAAYNAQLLTFLKEWKTITHFGKSSVTGEREGAQDQQSQKAVGHLMSEFLAAQWSSLHYLVTCAVLGVDMGQGGVDMAHYAAKCLDTVDLIRREELTSAFQCFKTIMPKLEGDLAVRVMSATWTKVKETLKTPSFLPLYELFIQLAFQPCNLTANQGTSVSSYLSQNAQEILSLGEDRRGLVNMLATQVCQWWEESPTNLTYASNYSSLVLEFCLWGITSNKGLRLMEEAQDFTSSLGQSWSVNQLIQINTKNDRTLRVMMLNMFSKLRLNVPEHCTFAAIMIEELMATQRHLVAVKTYKNFPNCPSHLRKHRVCCALLILDVFVSEVCLLARICRV